MDPLLSYFKLQEVRHLDFQRQTEAAELSTKTVAGLPLDVPFFRDLTIFGSSHTSFTASWALCFLWAPAFGLGFQHVNSGTTQTFSLYQVK